MGGPAMSIWASAELSPEVTASMAIQRPIEELTEDRRAFRSCFKTHLSKFLNLFRFFEFV